jgi:membrane associated rhomboid family serine protease
LYGRGSQLGFGPRFTPPVVKQLIFATVAVHLLQFALQVGLGMPVTTWLAVTPALVWERFFVWQPVTYMWLHALGQPFHVLFNMLALWMFGSEVAAYWGPRRFLSFYLGCGIGAGILIAAVPAALGLAGWAPASYAMPTLGASGAVYGVLLAYSMLWPDRTLMLIFPPVPLKAIYLIPFLFAMDLLSLPSNVSHVGHLGGVVVGWILLQRMGASGGLSFQQIRYRLRRWRLRRELRAVRDDEWRDRVRQDRGRR